MKEEEGEGWEREREKTRQGEIKRETDNERQWQRGAGRRPYHEQPSAREQNPECKVLTKHLQRVHGHVLWLLVLCDLEIGPHD